MKQLRHQSGFTLIELMVVIVIISIMASLVVMNISGVDQRKAMQARDMLIMDLKRINRLANNQSNVFGLVVEPATDVNQFKYTIKQYQDYSQIPSQQNSVFGQKDQIRWLDVTGFEARELPAHVSFQVISQNYQFKNANQADLLGDKAPKLIWFGNGESKPVTIQMYYDQKAIGEIIQVDYLGKVDEST